MSPPSAIEPQRVMILSEEEQRTFTDNLAEVQAGGYLKPHEVALYGRLAHGEPYDDEIDEAARITLAKRRLETEIKRINLRLAAINDAAIDRLADMGAKSMRHEGTGALVARDDTIRLAFADPDWSTYEKAVAKESAGSVLAASSSTHDFVQPSWTHARVEAYYRELYRTLVATNLEKPPHERVDVDPDAVIPAALRPFYRLNVTPKIKVTQ